MPVLFAVAWLLTVTACVGTTCHVVHRLTNALGACEAMQHTLLELAPGSSSESWGFPDAKPEEIKITISCSVLTSNSLGA